MLAGEGGGPDVRPGRPAIDGLEDAPARLRIALVVLARPGVDDQRIVWIDGQRPDRGRTLQGGERRLAGRCRDPVCPTIG